jgi:hypothetical protein
MNLFSEVRTKHSTQTEHRVEFYHVKPGGSGPDSSVGIATVYGLDGPRIESL